MDFTDWRKTTDKQPTDTETTRPKKYYGKQFEDYIAEKIREAEARGEFDNLRGVGKPLNLDNNPYAGDKTMGIACSKVTAMRPKRSNWPKRYAANLGVWKRNSRNCATRAVLCGRAAYLPLPVKSELSTTQSKRSRLSTRERCGN